MSIARFGLRFRSPLVRVSKMTLQQRLMLSAGSRKERTSQLVPPTSSLVGPLTLLVILMVLLWKGCIVTPWRSKGFNKLNQALQFMELGDIPTIVLLTWDVLFDNKYVNSTIYGYFEQYT
jgi:hypothetical protein